MKEKRKAIIIAILMFGIISCFGDVVYEGARSANGQYFSLLSINAATIGVLYGIGEFIGYALRLFSGRLSDKTGKHWPFIFIGYGLLIVVPLMGVTKSIPILILLFLLERIGKALRAPAKDTILSQVAENSMGTGMIFGIQEALDQLGAFMGPLVFTICFMIREDKGLESYQFAYKTLVIGFALVMVAVYIAYKKISKFNLIKDGDEIKRSEEKLSKIFWVYSIFTFVTSMGFIAYSIVGYHLKANNIVYDDKITLLYSFAMIIDAIMAIIIGKIYDAIKKKKNNKKAGLNVLIFIPILTMMIPFTILSKNIILIIIGFVLYGVVLGAHETIMKSAIADITSFKKRGTAYGIFNCLYGLAFLVGSSIMGILYDKISILSIIVFTVIVELIALGIYALLRKSMICDVI